MRRRRFLAVVGAGGFAGCAADESTTPSPGPVPAQYRRETETVVGGTAETATPTNTLTPAESETEEPTATSTPTETATGTPALPAPEILAVALVDEWEEAGDIDDQVLAELRPGALVAGAARSTVPVHDGRVRARVEARVLRGGTLVDEGTERVDAATDETGTVEWEAAVDFATGPWADATHTLEMRVTDPVTGLASEPVTTTFEVLEAAGSG